MSRLRVRGHLRDYPQQTQHLSYVAAGDLKMEICVKANRHLISFLAVCVAIPQSKYLQHHSPPRP